MGTLVTLDLPADAPALSLPWIITFAPDEDGDEDWDPVVCGPYSRAHALALAEAVVSDEELTAVVEPLQPAVTVDQILGEIAASRLTAEDAAEEEDDETEADAPDHDHDHDHDDEYEDAGPPPSPEEIRAGFKRIADELSS